MYAAPAHTHRAIAAACLWLAVCVAFQPLLFPLHVVLHHGAPDSGNIEEGHAHSGACSHHGHAVRTAPIDAGRAFGVVASSPESDGACSACAVLQGAGRTAALAAEYEPLGAAALHSPLLGASDAPHSAPAPRSLGRSPPERA